MSISDDAIHILIRAHDEASAKFGSVGANAQKLATSLGTVNKSFGGLLGLVNPLNAVGMAMDFIREQGRFIALFGKFVGVE